MQEGEQEERFHGRVVCDSAVHTGDQSAWTFLYALHFLHIFPCQIPTPWLTMLLFDEQNPIQQQLSSIASCAQPWHCKALHV